MEFREIWFKCPQCQGEAYCGSEFERLDDPDVMCPFCREIFKLNIVRIS